MKYIILLSVITIIALILGFLIYKRTKSFAIIIGYLLIYYWTFNGAWLFVLDVLSGFQGKDLGLTYYIIEKKMFPLNLDGDYFLAILYYGMFFLSLQLTMLWVLYKRKNVTLHPVLPIQLSSRRLLLISVVALVLSYICIHHKVMEGIATQTSIYYMVRLTPNRFNTLHMIFCAISVFTVYFTLVIYISAKSKYFILTNSRTYIGVLIALQIFIISVYFIIIGNKHDLMFAGIFGFVFYFANTYKFQWKKIVLFIAIIVLPLMTTDFFRGIPLLNYVSKDADAESYTTKKLPAFTNVLFNNEMFYAHFSMYGSLSHDIQTTHGKSLVSLAESMIPRVIKPNRVEDVYQYYARSIHAKEGQGYTIHHATGWYLNFGIIGLILGGMLLGFVWAMLIKMNAALSIVKRKFLLILFIMGPSLLVAFLPNFIRMGIEVYKPFIFEALLIPAFIVYLAQADLFKKLFRKKIDSKNVINA